MGKLIDKALVLLGAVPLYGAAAVGLLTAFQTQIVPLLPGPTGVQVAAWIVSAIAQIQAVASTVSRVTPVLGETDKGLLPARDDV